MANKKIRHHTVPKFCLEGFIDPNNKPYIWMYEKGNDSIIKTTAINIAVQKNYYSYTKPDGTVDSTFEDILGRIETEAGKVFQKIKNHQDLDIRDRGNFALFLTFMRHRVPNFRKNVENVASKLAEKFSLLLAANPEIFNSTIDGLERHKGIKLEIPREDLQQYMSAGEYDIEVNPKFSLAVAAASAIDIRIYKNFFDMNWTFLIAPEDYKFVTCDNPVYYDDPTHDPDSSSGVGLLNKNVEVTFPISRDIAFLGTWRKDVKTGYWPVNKSLVENVNLKTVLSASRFVFSSQKSDELNNLVQKYKDFSPTFDIN